MLKYQDYILESKVYQLILESNIEFSKKFINILSMIKSPIAGEILKLQGVDKNVTQNFIDANLDDPNVVSFIQDNTAQQLIGKDKDIWIVSNNGRMLKYQNFSSTSGEENNKRTYELLGVEMTDVQKIDNNKEVKLVNEAISPFNDNKVYCYVETLEDPIQKMVINKTGIGRKNNDGYQKVWNQSRNSMRIGRFITRLIPLTGKTFSNADVEKFVNEWKATIDIMNDAFLKFDVVSGNDIFKWYRSSNTLRSSGGTIDSSCMLDTPENCLYIYINNPEKIQMVILYDDSGSIDSDGKYTSRKIAGRAILWKTDEGDMFMDRIYYSNDDQVELFRKYSESNGWWAKKQNNSQVDFSVIQGETVKNDIIYHVTIKKWSWGFPYLDSLPCFDNGILTNDESEEFDKYLQDTWDEDDD